MADVYTQRPAQRPRSSSMLSWGSHKSKDSGHKQDLTETQRDKAQRRITGKADPRVAMNELQPSAQALEKSTLTPLRTMQFRDQKGDLITDPDRSNPTRPRFERPLDTIRSFEAAIDNGYARRRHTTQPDESLDQSEDTLSDRSTLTAKAHGTMIPSITHQTPEDETDGDSRVYDIPMLTYMPAQEAQSRRSSFYQGYASPQPRTPGNFNGNNNNPYFDRQPDSRPESLYDPPPQSAGQYGGYQGSPSNSNGNGYWNGSGNGSSGQNRRMPHGRMNSEPMYSSNNNGYSQQARHGYQQSYDTGTVSTAGTYQTEQGTASTDLSSYGGSNGEASHLPYYAKPQPPPPPQETYGIEFDNQEEDEYGQPATNANGYSYSNNNASPVSPQGYGPNGMAPRGRSYGNPNEMANGNGAAPPPPPQHKTLERRALRKPVGNNAGQMQQVSNGYNGHSNDERAKPEKRKSWLARRFSKHQS